MKARSSGSSSKSRIDFMIDLSRQWSALLSWRHEIIALLGLVEIDPEIDPALEHHVQSGMAGDEGDIAGQLEHRPLAAQLGEEWLAIARHQLAHQGPFVGGAAESILSR
jgi:hypothetical protein